ncbi:alpha/beta fold hydrolase [Plantactinospora sp. BB1]|uniref:alpha/beta fold hydrolase n=1 Tax=Plantactinospora sp. BB1 TaxID=2071627 RepID=UPI000D1532DC|nr:alpha/beta fold hydrolase [Plantactinospora sp. BB1]AVT35980.1 alpha/beta hydrolase [Plantactinospora sp. BB1]
MASSHVRRKKSTIVRSFSRAVVIGGSRVLFGALEHLAPEAGGRLALRLWCTPPRRRTTAPTVPAGPGGAATFTGPYDGAPFTVDVNGSTVTGRAWGSGPLVYLAHGWGGSASQLHGFVPTLVAAGYRVVAWDAPSHGRSGPGALGPHRGTLAEFADALVAVVRAHGPAHAVLAHSLGATASGLAVLDGLAVHRLVMIAPMADPLPYIQAFRRTLGIGPKVGDRLVAAMESLVGRPIADYDLGTRARAAGELPPLLVVQDRKDREVDPADGVTIATAWPGRLHRTTGLGHVRILADPDVVRRVVDFVHDTEPEPGTASQHETESTSQHETASTGEHGTANGSYAESRGTAGTGPAPDDAARRRSGAPGGAGGDASVTTGGALTGGGPAMG